MEPYLGSQLVHSMLVSIPPPGQGPMLPQYVMHLHQVLSAGVLLAQGSPAGGSEVRPIHPGVQWQVLSLEWLRTITNYLGPTTVGL